MVGTNLMDRRVLVMVGGYGAGKTQLSISLALKWAREGKRVALADLDLINPYFRLREMAEPLESEGVEVIRPEGDLAFAENPSLPAQIDGALRDQTRHVVLDVGGNETGATILGRYHTLLNEEDVAVLQVVNVFRPFSSTIEEIERLRLDMERKSHLKVQGWINNSNLIDWTTLEDWQRSVQLMQFLVGQSEIPLVTCGVNPKWAKKVGLLWEPEWIPVERYLNLGWKSPVKRW
jgi:type II secretory pathway predicted ATPase ExeA